MATSLEKQICRELSVTPTGLSVLARAAASPDGKARGQATGNSGSANVRLADQGYLSPNEFGGFYESTITDAGREVVRRARAMGW